MRGPGRLFIGGALLFGAVALWFFVGASWRVLCGLAVLAFAGCTIAFIAGRARRAFIICGLAVVVLALSPVEVSLRVRRGRPGIVPLLMGLPSQGAMERAQRGELVLGGCVTSGFEPRWVVIW
jgi:hypothetical protein